MIFVTVGTELPFDRMVRIVDEWAHAQSRSDVFAQIGHTTSRPSHIACSEFLEPAEFNRRFAEASVIIAHAGMGTILSALRFEKPILVMPRRAALGEHRSDHQLSTIKRLRDIAKFAVALDEVELRHHLDHLDDLQVQARTGAFAPPTLTAAIADFIHQGPTRERSAPELGRAASAPASLSSVVLPGAAAIDSSVSRELRL